MKIYLAGKITGDPNYKRKFSAVESVLRDDGHIVLNPAILPEGLHPKEYMRICFSMIDIADVVAFMPDWRSSLGAKLEFDYCEYVSKKTFFLADTAEWQKASRVIEQKATPEKLCCLNCEYSMWDQVYDKGRSVTTIVGTCTHPDSAYSNLIPGGCCKRHSDLADGPEVRE